MPINIIQNIEMGVQCYSVIVLYNMTYSSYSSREGPAFRQTSIYIYTLTEQLRHSLISVTILIKRDLRFPLTFFSAEQTYGSAEEPGTLLQIYTYILCPQFDWLGERWSPLNILNKRWLARAVMPLDCNFCSFLVHIFLSYLKLPVPPPSSNSFDIKIKL